MERIRVKGEIYGEKIPNDELVDKTFIIKDFTLRPSRLGQNRSYAVIQCEFESGLEFWTTCGADRILNALAEVADRLPVKVTLRNQPIPGGRKVKYFDPILKV